MNTIFINPESIKNKSITKEKLSDDVLTSIETVTDELNRIPVICGNFENSAALKGGANEANAELSFAVGYHTVANHEVETAVGKYNISRENYALYGGADGSHTIFSVGVGNESSAANALEVSSEGDVFVNKQLYIGDPADIDNSEDMMAKHRVVTGEEFDSVKEKVYDFFDNPDLKDETIDTLKEIQDYIDSDASGAREMLNQINEAKKSAASAHTNINAKIATVKIDLDKKLESGNLKTINGNSIVGTGNLEIVPYAQVSLLDIQNSNFKVIPGQWYEITGYYEEDPSFILIGLAIGNDKFAPKGFAKRVIEGGNVEVYEVMFDATIKSGNVEGVEEWSYNIQSSTIDFPENFTVEPIASNHLVVIPKYDTDDSGIINGENNPTDYIFDTTTPIYESPILATQSHPLTMSLAQAEVLKEIFSGETPYAPSYTVEVETRVEDDVEYKVITSVTRDGEVVEENNFFSVDGLFEERVSSYWNEDDDCVYLEITLKYDNNESSFTLTSDVYDVIVEISDDDDQYLECLKNVLAPKLLYADTVSDYNVYFMLSGIKVKEDKIWTNLVALHPVTSEEDTIVFTPLYLEDSSGNYEQCDVLLEDGECDHWSNYGHIPITFDLESNYTNNIKETIGTFNANILHMKDSRGNEAPYDFVHTKINNKFTFSAANGEENSANCRNNSIGGVGAKQSNVFFVGNVNNNTVLPGAEDVVIKSSGNFIGPGNHNNKEIQVDYTVLLNGMVTSM